jgi:hypothetical protein
MNTTTAYLGVVEMAHRMWSFHAASAPAAAISAQPKRRANAAPTIASVDRSFI